MKSIQLFIMLVLTTLSLSALLPAYAENNTSATSSKVIAPSEKDVNGIQVLEAFDKQKEEKEKQDQDQLIGIPLLLLLFTTGALGIAVGVFDKPWFVAHMIFAGLTMTLAIVHLIVGLVWFYPF
ncbi:MAG: hypothetical protein B7X47_02145 [Ferrovum sp. 34-44-207]|nr:MAG: hypothetical protein B7X47_02145 [Ferrovum sp. 34-44-207]